MIEKDGGKLLLSAMGHSNIPEVFKIDNNCGQLIFSDVKYIDLSNNEIVEVDGFFCRNLESLTHLDLR
jgi:Leucine-rich repeat (LRR) protein